MNFNFMGGWELELFIFKTPLNFMLATRGPVINEETKKISIIALCSRKVSYVVVIPYDKTF